MWWMKTKRQFSFDENRFHNCARESEKALLVPVSTKESRIEQHSKQDSYLIKRFYSQLLRYNKRANGGPGEETALLGGKDTLKQ